MSRADSTPVVGTDPGADDGLLLPRPPGVLRRFWSRHPRLADVLIAGAALLLSLPSALFRSGFPTQPTAAETALASVLVIAACVALVFRRRWPLLVFALCVLPSVVLAPSLVPATQILPAFALYAVAVYRSARAAWSCFGIACAALTLATAIAAIRVPSELSLVATTLVSGVVVMLIGGLLGTNVGNRRRYLEALIDRSRQLLVERDQQAQLAAAAERTRIAREMHDIVSHNLTVVVALAEGATATADPERARTATEQIAATARGALTEMRAMLGVLREPEATPGALLPLESASFADAVEAAQRAGFPVVLHTEGSLDGLPADIRLATFRVVQESLTNAMRHAPRATLIDVQVVVDEAAVDVVVVNNGVPSVLAAISPGVRGGYGIPGLRERAAHVGGSFTAGPGDDGRWLVRARIPLPTAPREERRE
ncbi:sensor histidine kinase [Microbacterium sp. SSM24]|uniref:sensor histidine kinase n=1 Tax=Microbacterium sp. SSM24 TaxID=2991714 RepID=UPI002227F069|nr:histidine kinase [Microbacterium sp. SSM24]MCW3493382.1 histidine kinase [Microbacterium sp. SSM24]